MRVQISEENLITAALDMSEDTANPPRALLEALDTGKTFKEHGLKPFYILDDDIQEIIVTSEEHMENRLN